MLCQVCNKNQATIHYKSNLNGHVYEKHMCASCAEKENFAQKETAAFGELDSLFANNSDGLFGGLFAGMINENAAKTVSGPKVCPACGMRFSEFLETGKIGCAECYKAFSSSLYPTLKRIHGNTEHCGKVPFGLHNKKTNIKKIEQLRAKLNEAIEKQEYEMAAKYRDEIKELEKQEGEEK